VHSTRFVVAAVVTTTTTTTTTTIVMPFCRCCTTIWMTVVDFAMNFKPLRRVDQVVYTLAYILCELRCQFRVCSLLCRDNVYNVNWCIWLGALNCAWWLVQSRRTDLNTSTQSHDASSVTTSLLLNWWDVMLLVFSERRSNAVRYLSLIVSLMSFAVFSCAVCCYIRPMYAPFNCLTMFHTIEFDW